MGQKVHPVAFRLGHLVQWKSRWFNRKKYQQYLKQDVKLRDFIVKKFDKAGVDKIEIERSTNLINIIIHTSRPGFIIGRGGSGVEDLKGALKGLVAKENKDEKLDIKIEIEEVREPESHAKIMAFWIKEQIERRIPYRRILKQALEKITQSKSVQGAKVMAKGRLNGAEIARTEWLAKGKLPLQNLRADIDYASVTAFTTYGTIGVKVWIYKGERFEK